VAHHQLESRAHDAFVYHAEMLRQSAEQAAQADFGNRAGAQPLADEIAAFKQRKISRLF
jgi:hypothetical protein